MRHAGRTVAVVTSACLLLGACGNGSKGSAGSGDEKNFIEGTGVVSTTPVDERGAPVELKGPLLGGGEFDLAAHRGKVVLINVWGSWCAPCRGEAPALQEAWKDLEPRGVQFVGLNTKNDAEAAAIAFERNFGITYPSVSDPDGQLQLVFRKTLPPTSIPSSIVLDKEGRVAGRIVGAGTFTKLKTLVEDILAET